MEPLAGRSSPNPSCAQGSARALEPRLLGHSAIPGHCLGTREQMTTCGLQSRALLPWLQLCWAAPLSLQITPALVPVVTKQ